MHLYLQSCYCTCSCRNSHVISNNWAHVTRSNGCYALTRSRDPKMKRSRDQETERKDAVTQTQTRKAGEKWVREMVDTIRVYRFCNKR